MKKFGFTLSEVLLAVALVGIVSALTVPTFVTESQNKASAATLSAAISNFETATRTMIQAEDVNNIFQTRAWRELNNAIDATATPDNQIAVFKSNLGQYLDLSNWNSNIQDFYEGDTLRNIERAAIGYDFMNTRRHVAFSTNSNITYLIYIPNRNGVGNRLSETQLLQAGINLQQAAASIIIDVNGKNKPNMVGRDMFYFILGSDGVLYPYGGRDVSFSLNGNVDSVWDGNRNFICTDNNKTDNGIGCTARLIENGFKMDY